MIINVRGTNGSGKSTVVSQFIKDFPSQPVYGCLGPRRPEAYRVQLPNGLLHVIGPYITKTGGCDALGLCAPDLVTLIEKYRVRGHVIFEGIVISTYFGWVGEWLVKNKDESVVVLLDTPLEVCIKAVADRNPNYRPRATLVDGTPRPENKSKDAVIGQKDKSVRAVCKRMADKGVRVETLSRTKAFKEIRGWMGS